MTIARQWAQEELRAIAERGLLRGVESLGGRQGARVRIDGVSLINFTSNDYLGLSGDERLVRAAKEALDVHGTGGGASRLLAGGTTLHDVFEREVADWMEAESAVLFNTGVAANTGVLPALAGASDEIFSDALNHASIVDGCRLSRAKVSVYPHVDVDALAALLRGSTARRKVVVTDSLFSMDGDVAPLRDIVELCERFDAALVVDEAHAVGVHGAGVCASLGLQARVDVRVGTLGKALGSSGAFAVGAKELTSLFINRSRSLIFSTALAAVAVASALEALRIIRASDALRRRLDANMTRFAEGLRSLGFEADAASPIFPVILGEPERAVRASAFLRARGVLVKPIRPPTVPVGTSRLRFTVTAAHESEDIDCAIEALAGLQKEEANVR